MSDLNPYEEGLAIDLAKAQARIEELEADLRSAKISEVFWQNGWRALDQDKRSVDANLAKAVKAMEFWSQAQEPEIDAAINLMQTTLAELKGEDRG